MGELVLDSLKDDTVLNGRRLAKYQRDSAVLHDELVYLHSNLKLLTQLDSFPRDLFEAPPALFAFLARALTTDCVLACFRVWLDKRRTTLTLRRFSTWLLEFGVRPEFRTELKARLDAALPSPQVEEVAQRLLGIRHATLAHLDAGVVDGIKSAPTQVDLVDLRSVADGLASYFNAVAFGGQHRFVIAQFMPFSDDWHKGDLGYMLERVALGSKWFSAPEDFPDYFERNMRPSLSADELETINAVRKRNSMDLLQ